MDILFKATFVRQFDKLDKDLQEEVLEKIFSSTPMLIAVHCEDETTIKNNLEKYKAEYGEDIPVKFHH